ncbi:NUDIX domain-containing protein [Chloroflexi bacterium TSY]|nr:NUDIX domain-containing protein [Chloroflexi bacterium TSY]
MYQKCKPNSEPPHNFMLQPGSSYLTSLQEQASVDQRTCVVGGLIVNQQGRIFVQKRRSDRDLFPGCWDIAGGHVEDGETLYEALSREIHEETGWHLSQILQVVEIFDWQTDLEDSTIRKREFDFLVAVMGDLENPQIETEKFSEFRWIGADELGILLENRSADDNVIYRLVQQALDIAHPKS